MAGVATAQLFRLQHTAAPARPLGFFVLGKPLAGALIGLAMAVLLLGACRWWRQQRAMVRGRVLAGGFEVVLIMAASLAVRAARCSPDLAPV